MTLFIKDWYLGVTNNKLEVQGDFGNLIQNTKRCKSTERDIMTRFEDWPKQSHPEGLWLERPPYCSSRTNIRYYKSLKYGRGDDDVWREGQKVRFVIVPPAINKTTGGKRKRGGQGGASAQAVEHLGRILHFELEEDAESCK